jgi:hypothetical protein
LAERVVTGQAEAARALEVLAERVVTGQAEAARALEVLT